MNNLPHPKAYILKHISTVPFAMQSNMVSNFKDCSMHILKKHYRAY